MPSDARVQQLLEAFRPQRNAFRAAVHATVDQVRNYLADHAVHSNGRAQRAGTELGVFARGRIDFERFSSLLTDRQTIDKVTLETMEHALNTLSALTAVEDGLYCVDVEPGRNLRDAVARALEEIGRAFGAARVFELSRTGQYNYAAHARSLGSFPFARWARAERRVAPPVLVEVDGSDVQPAGLSEFLDGALKLVLVVRGPMAPAPLVRLITPRTFVVQCRDVSALEGFVTWDGPGLAALVPDSAAEFMHDPEAGSELWRRISVTRLPEQVPRKPLGGLSPAQQLEELRQLEALAERPTGDVAAAKTVTGDPAAQTTAPVPPAPSDPVDKLAAWLLSQADLSDLG